jgi:hypothetical protein
LCNSSGVPSDKCERNQDIQNLDDACEVLVSADPTIDRGAASILTPLTQPPKIQPSNFLTASSSWFHHDEIIQINSYGFSLAPWTFLLIGSKITFINRVRSPHSKRRVRQAEGWEGSGNWGRFPEPLIPSKKKVWAC